MNPYEVLGVDANADHDTIRNAYRRRAQRAHPDRAGGSAQAMALLVEAYAILTDPVRKEHFDLCGASQPVPPLRERAHSALLGVLDAMIMQGHESHLVERARYFFQQKFVECQQAMDNAEVAKAKIERQRRSLKYKSDALDTIFETKIKTQKAAILVQKLNLEAGMEALRLLDEYGFEDLQAETPGPMFMPQFATSRSAP